MVPVYTIGHGGRTLQTLSRDLNTYNIYYLIDVRSQPYSRYQPEFNREKLKQVLDIRYLWLGDSLGGRPEDGSLYTDGRANYSKMCRESNYLQSLNRLVNASTLNHVVCVMCSEKEPTTCHRNLLIGKSLYELGIEVVHIEGNGKSIAHKELAKETRQQGLFGEENLSVKKIKR